MAEETTEIAIPCECGHSFEAHQIVQDRCWYKATKVGKKRYYCSCTGGYVQMDNLDYLVWKKKKGLDKITTFR